MDMPVAGRVGDADPGLKEESRSGERIGVCPSYMLLDVGLRS
jgi:hypothetical protein